MLMTFFQILIKEESMINKVMKEFDKMNKDKDRVEVHRWIWMIFFRSSLEVVVNGVEVEVEAASASISVDQEVVANNNRERKKYQISLKTQMLFL